MVHRLDAKVASYVTRLKEKTALVTGGGTGIGRAIALAFAREGAKVAVLGRRPEPLNEVVTELAALAAHGVAIACDVTRSRDTRNAVAEVERAFGRLNVLVNNAGALSVSTVESISEDDWDRVIETNLKGPFLFSRAALPAFRRAGGGSIINIGSVLGLVAMRDRAAYCASKGGLTLLSKAMALDHARENIRVNCICPSIVETELVKHLFAQNEQGMKARDARIGTLPLGRFGQPRDVAELAVFLASDESSWMTGTAIPVDGGLSAY
jgi:NAD(P)-dependent dehydrogenase (short-subunit alcohol dehydrogenase family)